MNLLNAGSRYIKRQIHVPLGSLRNSSFTREQLSHLLNNRDLITGNYLLLACSFKLPPGARGKTATGWKGAKRKPPYSFRR